MKRITAWLVTAALAVSMLAGCGAGPAPAAAPAAETADTGAASAEQTASSAKTRTSGSSRAENSLNIGISTAPNTLDPALFALQVEDEIIMQVYEPLVMTMNDGNIEPVLAESFTVNDDNSVDFVLKEGVKYHSGDTLKAEDVEYSLSRIENSAILAPVYGMIETEIQDDLHFTWTFPYADQGVTFYALMPYLDAFCILNKSWADERLSSPTDQIGLEEDGTGAFCFESIADNGDVTLKRFADYHGEVSLDTVNLKIITGDEEMAFESGDLDMARYNKSTFDVVSAYANVHPESYPVNSVGFMIMNCAEGKPTADLRVRQAIAYALDREVIASVASDDGGEVAYNLASPMVDYWADVADHFDQDVDKATSLLTEAGYSESNKVPLTLIVMGAYTEWISACEVIKEQLEQTYFTVNIEQTPDTDRYFTGDFDLGFLAIGLTTSFTSYQTMFSDLNLALYESSDVQDAFAAIKDEATTQAAMKTVTESLAYLPLFYPYAFYIFDDQLNIGELYSTFSGFLYKDFSWK